MDETQSKLLDAAGPIFAERGYRAATVREICQQAGTNLAAISYHFGDKENFYVAAVQHAARGCMDRVPLPDFSGNETAEERLHLFVLTMLNRVAVDHDPAWHAQLLMREMVLPTRACAEFVRDYVRPMHDMLMSIVSELMPGESEQRRWLTAASIVGQCLHHRFGRAVMNELAGDSLVADISVDALARHITEFSLAAIGASASEADGRLTAVKKTRRRIDAASGELKFQKQRGSL